VVADGFDQLVDAAAHLVARRRMAWGLQLQVSMAGQVVFDATFGTDGLGVALDGDSLLTVYCATKPIVSIAFAQLVESGDVSFDDRLGDVLTDARLHPQLRATTFADLLTHTAGLPAPMAAMASMLPANARDHVALA